MNPTRKEIIGLIEPYMDKTLSFGCLVVVQVTGLCTLTSYLICETETKVYMDRGSYRKKTPSIFPKEKLKRIIGHYTLDAVLKYASSKSTIRFESVFGEYGAVVSLSNQKGKEKPYHTQRKQDNLPLFQESNKMRLISQKITA